MLPLLVLAVLEDGECYGHDLSRKLEAAGLGPIKGGTQYPVLTRLERDGAILEETRDHLDASGQDPEATFGPASDYAAVLADSRDAPGHAARYS